MAHKICSKCQEFNSASAMVCSNCGNSLTNVKLITTSDEVKIHKRSDYQVCPACHSKLKLGTRNCSNCGEFIAKGVANNSLGVDYDNCEYQSGSGNVVLYILSFLIPLVGFIVGAIYLTNDKQEKKDTGIICIILGIISCVISAVIFNVMIKR